MATANHKTAKLFYKMLIGDYKQALNSHTCKWSSVYSPSAPVENKPGSK